MQLLFITTVTPSGFVTENLAVLSAQTVGAGVGAVVGTGVGTGVGAEVGACVIEQTLQVRGHLSFAPVQLLHLSHLFFLATLHNEK